MSVDPTTALAHRHAEKAYYFCSPRCREKFMAAPARYVEPAKAGEVAEAMRFVFDAGAGDPECIGFAVRPDYQGLQRLEP